MLHCRGKGVAGGIYNILAFFHLVKVSEIGTFLLKSHHICIFFGHFCHHFSIDGFPNCQKAVCVIGRQDRQDDMVELLSADKIFQVGCFCSGTGGALSKKIALLSWITRSHKEQSAERKIPKEWFRRFQNSELSFSCVNCYYLENHY